MEFARPLPLDAAGQPQSTSDEVQYRLQESVDVYDKDTKSRRGDVCIITSHRLAIIDSARKAPLQWHLSQILAVSAEEGGLFIGSAKVVFHVRPLPVPGKDPGAETRRSHVKLSFKSGGRDAFLESARKAVERKSWEITMAAPAEKRPRLEPVAVLHTPGIGGIMRKQVEDAKMDAALAKEAFADLNELERHAKQIVTLTETYAAEIARRKAADAAAAAGAGGASGAASDETADMNKELGALITNMGIINPVTRAAAGNLFNTEVARQLASFLRPVLERSGGMLALTDVYCLYNRARVTELISPEDLLEAAKLLAPLGVGMRLRAFASGLQVVQLDSFSDAATGSRIADLLGGTAAAAVHPSGARYITALQLAAKWKIPLQIAQQQLLLAESNGSVCRDDSINGLRFYPNLFAAMPG